MTHNYTYTSKLGCITNINTGVGWYGKYLIVVNLERNLEIEMDLESIGWSSFFKESLDKLLPEGLEVMEHPAIGRVSFFDGSHYEVLTEDGEVRARPSSRVINETPPAVGDWVVIRLSETHNTIVKVLERKGFISRKAAGREVKEQPVAANVNIIFIVMGLDNDFNLRRLERYIAMAAASGARGVILLNKSDKVDDVEEKMDLVSDVAGGVPFHDISALTGDGMEVVRSYLNKGVTGVLVGSSGVGKSTLINSLLGEERQRTIEVRTDDNKGRHATTSRELIPLPEGGVLVDNPGLRELQLWGDASMVEDAFQDIKELSMGCRFKDCQHLSEPGCRVQEAVENGEMDPKRYENYLKLRKELHYLSVKMDKGAQAQERAKWKGLTKDIKHYQRYKKEGK